MSRVSVSRSAVGTEVPTLFETVGASFLANIRPFFGWHDGKLAE